MSSVYFRIIYCGGGGGAGFPCGSSVKNSLAMQRCRRLGSILGLGRFPGGGNGSPF